MSDWSDFCRKGQAVAAEKRRQLRIAIVLKIAERILEFRPAISDRDLSSAVYRESTLSLATTKRALADIRKNQLIRR